MENQGVLRPANRFFEWWFGELGMMVPGVLRQGVTRRADGLIIEWTATDVSFVLCRTGKGPRILGTTADPSALDRSAVLAMIGKRAGTLPVTVALGADVSVRQTCELPLAAEATLRDVVGFEMDRLTPFRRDEVYFDSRLVRRRPAEQKLDAEILLAPKQSLDGILATIGTWDLNVARVDLMGAARGQTEGVNLLGPKTTGDGRSFGSRVFPALCLAALVLGGAAVAVDLNGKHASIAAVKSDLAAARKQVAAFDELRQSVSAYETAGRYLTHLKSDRPLAVQTLDAVTALLPDDSYLVSFRLDGARLILSGYAAQSSALIAAFETAPRFSDVKFMEPIVQAPRLGLEKFSLAMTVEGEARP